MFLSIVIVNYNSSSVLKNCLESIRKNKNGLDLEVIIVDSNSPKENEQANLLLFEKEYQDLALKLMLMEDNRGFGAANNKGARRAVGKYLFILNADTIVENNALCQMVDFLENNLHTAIVGPKLINKQKQIQEWSCGPKTSLLKTIKNNFGFIPKHLWQANSSIKVDWISGASLMIRKNVFNKIQGFDENFFMYFEDEDLCWRVKDLGYVIYYLGNTMMTHLGGQSFEHNNIKPLQKKYFYRSQDYFFEKHYGAVTTVFMKILRFLATR